MNTVEYAPRRWADVLGEPAQPTALLWHGTQTDSRAAVRPLAAALAERGMGVIAPDWDSHAPDGGRADLLQSVDFARRRVGAAALTLIGWSLGGAAAAGLALRASDFGVPVARAVCLGGAFMVADPISGGPPLDGVTPAASRPPMHLFVGTRDDVVPASAATEFAAGLRAIDWPVEIVEFDADHGSIAGARYDPQRDRYEPADDPATRAIVRRVAARISDVVHRPLPGVRGPAPG
ncbi:alpha/beta hydrolase [Mycolicibacterium cosmeticum]|uniref:Phospholipase/carboxylesterase n=1 Tax=Mycolicibacterium cosmeticum TaxID=258533 RepID=W9AR20_MYCCO|nr:alpha/beta fold hydrolase [Mycolicibacterium cosmeticum]TLH71868.1 alpha/beta hydrolase [Mycolicibacterium cosmeticum]CDO08214.1 phospholipase/carboxylesterase [Mycolicibacterium cosmeticum]